MPAITDAERGCNHDDWTRVSPGHRGSDLDLVRRMSPTLHLDILVTRAGAYERSACCLQTNDHIRLPPGQIMATTLSWILARMVDRELPPVLVQSLQQPAPAEKWAQFCAGRLIGVIRYEMTVPFPMPIDIQIVLADDEGQ